MKKKLLCTMLCITLTLSLAACGNSEKTATPKDSSKESVSTAKDSSKNSESEETESNNDDRNISFLLNLEASSDAILPDPENAQLFEDRQTLPIDLNNFMNYKVRSDETSDQGESQLETLAEKLANSTEPDKLHGTELLFSETTTSTSDKAIHTLSYDNKDDVKRSLKETLDQGLWYIEDLYPNYSTFGLTEEEGFAIKRDHDFKNNEDVYIRELYDEFGAPNYLWFFKGDDTDVSDYLEAISHPEVNNNNVNVAAYCVGWKFKDYSVSAYVMESSGIVKETKEYYDHVSNLSLRYMPNTYETLEECYGENMIDDFVKANK